MSTTLTALASITNAQERGYAFEVHVGDLLRREQFEVITKAGPANGRQVDLFANRGDRHYLIETKWRQKKAGIPEVDELLSRLVRGAPGIIGVLVSASGFAEAAVEKVERDPSHPILLVSGLELAQLEVGSFHRLLDAKHQRLIIHRKVAVQSGSLSAALSADIAQDLYGGYEFVDLDGQRRPLLELAGNFGPVTFCLDLPDLDWGDGRGVGVDLELTGSTLAELRQVFDRLSERGWITPKGTWRIHQQGATWNGFGLIALLDVLDNPDARYVGRLMHHSETLTYVDAAGGGLYTLTAQVGRTRFDRVSLMRLSFRLPGVPVDPGPLQTLVRGLDIGIDPSYRSLDSTVATRVPLPGEVRSLPLRAEAFIVGSPPITVTDNDSQAEEWVVGAVIRNPLRGRTPRGRQTFSPASGMLADLAQDNEFMVCALGSWHYLSERRDYLIDFIETVQIDDRMLTRVHLDWFEESLADRRRMRPRLSDWIGDRLEQIWIAAAKHVLDHRAERSTRVVRVEECGQSL